MARSSTSALDSACPFQFHSKTAQLAFPGALQSLDLLLLKLCSYSPKQHLFDALVVPLWALLMAKVP